jgi:hypothetical protein
MPDRESKSTFNIYQISIQGNLDAGWSHWFNWLELAYQEETHQTILTGPIADQAELRGILNKLWDLNQNIIAVTRLQDRI